MVQHLHGVVHQQVGVADTIKLHRLQPGIGVPAAEQDHGGAGIDREDQAHVLAGDPEQRDEADRDVVVPDAHGDRQGGGGGVEHVALGVHAALGHAGGAAGVVQRGRGIEVDVHTGRGRGHGIDRRHQVGRARARLHGFHQHRRKRQRRLGRQEVAQAGGEDLPDPGFSKNLLHHRVQLIQGHDRHGAAVLQLIGQLVLLEHRIDRHMDRAELQQAEKDDVELRAVLQVDGNRVPLADALGRQQRRETIARAVQFRVADAAAVIDDRRLVRLLRGPPAQILAERRVAEGLVQGFRQAGRPVAGLEFGDVGEIGGFGVHSGFFLRRARRKVPCRHPSARAGSSRDRRDGQPCRRTGGERPGRGTSPATLPRSSAGPGCRGTRSRAR